MIFEIHEVNDNILTKISSSVKIDDILVFDDGLYSQYYYMKEILNIKCKKYFAISTNLISNIDEEQTWNINRNLAMWLYKEKRIKNSYMNIDQIKEIHNSKDCFLCLHGHNHLKFKEYMDKHKNLKWLHTNFIEDFKISMNTFKDTFNFIPDSYCFPYNYTFNGFLEAIVKDQFPEIKTIFGQGRKEIN